MNVDKSFTGSVRLVDRKTRVVEVFGPESPGSRWPTDRKLLYQGNLNQRDYMRGPQPVGVCFAADGRTAKFLLDKSSEGEKLLDLLSKYPEAPSRLARPYGLTGWLVQE